MKTILFPTDFSEDSIKAFDFAIRYLSSDQTEFILLNVYQIPAANVSGTFYLLEELRKQSESDLKLFVKKLESQYKGKVLKITAQSVEGDFDLQCNTMAAHYAADCIIVGTKGASGVKEALVGSNTVHLMKRLNTPLFVVPFDFMEKEINEFILSYDGNNLTEKAAEEVKKFAAWFSLPVKAVHVKLAKDEAIENWEPIKALFEPLKISHLEVASENLEESLSSLVQAESAILCMVRHKKTFWENLFNRSDSRKAVMHAHTPVLVIPE